MDGCAGVMKYVLALAALCFLGGCYCTVDKDDSAYPGEYVSGCWGAAKGEKKEK